MALRDLLSLVKADLLLVRMNLLSVNLQPSTSINASICGKLVEQKHLHQYHIYDLVCYLQATLLEQRARKSLLHAATVLNYLASMKMDVFMLFARPLRSHWFGL